jgi:uncharacterized protein
MKKSIFAIVVLVMIAALAMSLSQKGEVRTPQAVPPQTADATEVTIGDEAFSAHVADTETARARGLSDFAALGPSEAMLFVFPNPGNWGIWMKDMGFAIDILWLDSDLKIISIEEEVSPETYPKIFFPSAPASYVIELPAGIFSSTGAKAGDTVSVESGK